MDSSLRAWLPVKSESAAPRPSAATGLFRGAYGVRELAPAFSRDAYPAARKSAGKPDALHTLRDKVHSPHIRRHRAAATVATAASFFLRSGRWSNLLCGCKPPIGIIAKTSHGPGPFFSPQILGPFGWRNSRPAAPTPARFGAAPTHDAGRGGNRRRGDLLDTRHRPQPGAASTLEPGPL